MNAAGVTIVAQRLWSNQPLAIPSTNAPAMESSACSDVAGPRGVSQTLASAAAATRPTATPNLASRSCRTDRAVVTPCAISLRVPCSLPPACGPGSLVGIAVMAELLFSTRERAAQVDRRPGTQLHTRAGGPAIDVRHASLGPAQPGSVQKRTSVGGQAHDQEHAREPREVSGDDPGQEDVSDRAVASVAEAFSERCQRADEPVRGKD